MGGGWTGAARYLVSIGLAEDVLDSLVDRVDGVSVLVGDLDAELLLDGHDDLDGVEAVETEVVGEVRGGLDVGGIVDLVEARQQAHDAALNLLLVQATGGAVHADGEEARQAGDGGRSSDSGADDGAGDAGGRADGGAGRGRGDGAKHGGAEHDCWREEEKSQLNRKAKR